ncbi:cytosine/adenosine deaminase-related metal-dependent hydrolase [Pararhizobium capsulatum DSM 1112]|uniref:Cytosine/adenosine deaminase-related metal-dependent hydrolase n=1 Tax=Pararhizobium capsulatum DSM 1112 TaxID=1121113 RepID=A0ABU0BY54_9HYPH|nr:amidohydrolase family protein [Pararhizobium capsulatum]MDQ0322862.1 cytosine/adenosine deaminase-related metal-dependent hydrolase [Pararhizobium capsulatum DSM 1112]
MTSHALHTLTLGERPAGRTLLTADWLLAWREGGHRLVPGGEMVMEDGAVIYAGPCFRGEVARRIDFGAALISPGLIDLDALSDLDTYTLVLDNQPGWARGRIWPRSYVERGPYEMYSQEELAFQKKFAFGLQLLNGVTTAAPVASLYYREWAETVAEFDAAADAAGELGLRVFLSPAYRSGGIVLEAPGKMVPVFDEARGLAGLNDAISFIERQQGRHGGLVNGMLAPDRVETCTLELLQRTMAAAGDLDCQVRLHMAQGPAELETMRALHGATGPGWMASHGLLGERLIAPHATYATDEDLRLYAINGVSIAHSPMVSARMGSVLNSFALCRRLGINIGMATDTAPPDMLMNLLMGLVTCRISEKKSDAVLSADLFNAATLGGAKALGRTDIGRLCSGTRADVAVFRLDDLYMTPSVDPITTLVLGGSGKVTQAVFVDGRISMLEGKLSGFDMHAARKQAQSQFEGLLAKYPERSWEHPPVEALFSPGYSLWTDKGDKEC